MKHQLNNILNLTTMDQNKMIPIKYNEATREQKRILYRFIKKVYQAATKRDVISGLHEAVKNENGYLYAVMTDLDKVAKYSKQFKN